MSQTKNLGHLAHLVSYDASNNITFPANLTVTGTIIGYATTASLGSYVPTSRTITINGTTFDLSADRSWNITSMIYPAAGIPLSTGSAWGTSITNNSANWNTAYGWGNHASAGYVPSARTITINGTTYDLTANRSWTVSGTDATKLPLSGGTMTGKILTVSTGTGTYDTAIEIRETSYATTSQSAWGYSPAMTFHWGGRHAKRFGMRSDGLFAVDDEPLALRSWVTSLGYITGSYLPLSGGTVTGVADFGTDSASNSGIGIRYASSSYGRIRFYQNGSNHQTIHSFGNDGYSPSNGKINIDGQNGANVGAWNDPDFIVNKGGHTYARGYRGIGNVAGTGEAVHAPAGIYSTGTNWLYGTMYLNSNSINGVSDIYAGGHYATNWFRAQGTCGLYQQDYGGHFARSTDGNYGTWQIWGGARGGYSGLNIIDPSNYWNNLMFEGGNGGMYQQNGNGWMWYYHRGNNCLSLGGSTTSPSYRAYVDGPFYAGSIASPGEIYAGTYFKTGGEVVLYNTVGGDHWRQGGSYWFTYGGVGSNNFFSTSTRDSKTNIVNFDRSAIDLLNTINIVEFNYKTDLNNKRIGFIAEDTVEEISTKDKNQMDINSSIGILIKAVQELSDENKELKQLINNINK